MSSVRSEHPRSERLALSCHRYASLYFCAGLDDHDNELLTLEVLHRYVELLDKYFGNVSVYQPGGAKMRFCFLAAGALTPKGPDHSGKCAEEAF